MPMPKPTPMPSLGLGLKLSIEDPERWYTHVKPVQQIFNSTYQRAIKTTPFQLLVGTEMRTQKDMKILEVIDEENIKYFEDLRLEQREKAKEDIAEIQKENKITFDKKRKEARKYRKGDRVAIERVQFGTGLKIRPKFLGPYRIISIKDFDRYTVQKEGEHEGPKLTDTCAEKMKPWSETDAKEDTDFEPADDAESSEEGSDLVAD